MICALKRKMTKAIAESVAADTAGTKNRKRIYAYQCRNCGFWHMTKQPPRAR